MSNSTPLNEYKNSRWDVTGGEHTNIRNGWGKKLVLHKSVFYDTLSIPPHNLSNK